MSYVDKNANYYLTDSLSLHYREFSPLCWGGSSRWAGPPVCGGRGCSSSRRRWDCSGNQQGWPPRSRTGCTAPSQSPWWSSRSPPCRSRGSAWPAPPSSCWPAGRAGTGGWGRRRRTPRWGGRGRGRWREWAIPGCSGRPRTPRWCPRRGPAGRTPTQRNTPVGAGPRLQPNIVREEARDHKFTSRAYQTCSSDDTEERSSALIEERPHWEIYEEQAAGLNS